MYTSYPGMGISCMTSRSVRSQSRGRALYRDASRAGSIRTVPASLKGRSQCMSHRVRTRVRPETPTCEVPSNGVVEISLLRVGTGDTSIYIRSSY